MDGLGIVIAAPASGSGKTVASCGIMAAFGQIHKKVRACKCGPDYIDPMFHKKVLGIESGNLDLFFCDENMLRERFECDRQTADITVVEGVMGYYDGIRFGSVEGSTYEVAKALGLPVILVLPCRGMAASVLAVLKGILEYQVDSNIRGIILNRVSAGIYPRMKEMIEQGLQEMGHEDTRVVGYLPENENLRLESRHLGLVTPEEIDGLVKQMDWAGALVSQTVDLEQILQIAAEHGVKKKVGKQPEKRISMEEEHLTPVRIAVARDRAFCFYYRDNLEYLQRLGCELVTFSPVSDRHLPPDCDGLVIGGGYPELYAKELSERTELLEEIRSAVEQGLPCLAECGGFQYLQKSLEGSDGKMYRMAGVIPSVSRRKGKLVRFGYVTVEGTLEGTYLRKGETIRGHEFHYWDSTDNGDSCSAVKPDGKRSWPCIYQTDNLFAGYPHLYYPSHPEFAKRFVRKCREYRERGAVL